MTARTLATDPRLHAPERDFQHAIESYLSGFGWLYFHDRPLMVCPHCRGKLPPQNRAGLPDLIATDGRTLLLPELKTMTGRIRPEQQEWADALATVTTVVSGIWRPDRCDELYALIAGGGQR